MSKPIVAVIGAGPAGLYASRQLSNANVEVVLLNRDIKPGGLAEYGIFFDKYKMKEGLRKQFRDIIGSEGVHYFGNVQIGEQAELSLADVQGMGFAAVLVTVGAQGTKWLGLEGEGLHGVYHAKDLVYHYNQLPPFAEERPQIGRKIAVIGAGNVMLDIANWVIRYRHVEQITAIVRRDPSAVKFTKKEMGTVFHNLDLAHLDEQIAKCAPIMERVGLDPQAAHEYILSCGHRAQPKESETRFVLEFLMMTQRILGDAEGNVCGLEVEETTLVKRADGTTAARKTGNRRVLDVDTVIFAIGDQVDEQFGLPITAHEFTKSSTPHYPQEGNSYETPLEGVFVAGWARSASDGLVGLARKDGENGAKAILSYLADHPMVGSADLSTILAHLQQLPNVVTKEGWQLLESAEHAQATQDNVPEYKFANNAAMLEVIRQART